MAKTIQARVICAFATVAGNFNPDQIVEGSQGAIKGLEKSGNVDSSAEAVAYAIEQGGKVVNLEPVAPVPEAPAEATPVADAAASEETATAAATQESATAESAATN